MTAETSPVSKQGENVNDLLRLLFVIFSTESVYNNSVFSTTSRLDSAQIWNRFDIDIFRNPRRSAFSKYVLKFIYAGVVLPHVRMCYMSRCLDFFTVTHIYTMYDVILLLNLICLYCRFMHDRSMKMLSERLLRLIMTYAIDPDL